jgi:long-chain acyl-CoA synthetase
VETTDVPVSRDPVDAPIPDLPETVAQMPFFAAGRFPKPNLLGQCRGERIEYLSGHDLLERVRDVSLGLTALGLSRGERVALLSESRPEWLVADFAALTAGAISAPVYTTLSAEQIGFILRDSGASFAVVSTAAQLAKVLSVAADAPALHTVVVIEPADTPAEMGVAGPGSDGGPIGSTADPARTADGPRPRVLSLDAVAAMGHQVIRDGWGVARQFQDTARSITPDDLATIIYTSGTTGEPKGVMLTHGNLIANLRGALAMLDLSHEDVALSFLPLCHAFERIVAYVYLTTGISMIFAESIETIPRDLLAVRPTVMSGVPRVFEKLYARVLDRGRSASGLRKLLFNWAVSIAGQRGARLPEGRPLPLGVRLGSPFAERLVFAKIRAGLGGRMRYAVSGSAPLDPAVGRFFYGIGLPILEGYGLTETAPVLCVMPIGRVRFGTVGPPLPNVELRMADDGEILARGPNVMRGYYNRPDDTARVLVDGWFHTGDIGSLDEAGYLRITDRKKEVIVTSGGKKIAPQPLEQKLRSHTLVSEAVLVGDRRHFPAALLVPNLPVLAAALGVPVDEARRRLGTADVHARFQQIIDTINRDLAQFERIKKFELVSDDWTIADGMLTPTLKVKRRVVEERYRDLIDRMYG